MQFIKQLDTSFHLCADASLSIPILKCLNNFGPHGIGQLTLRESSKIYGHVTLKPTRTTSFFGHHYNSSGIFPQGSITMLTMSKMKSLKRRTTDVGKERNSEIDNFSKNCLFFHFQVSQYDDIRHLRLVHSNNKKWN